MTAPLADTAPSCRERILNAAIDALVEEGYRASMERIAARAGVAKQTLYNHFPSKEALYAEVGAAYAETILEGLGEPGPDLRPALIRLGRNLRATALDPRSIAVLRTFLAEGDRVPTLHRIIRDRSISQLDHYVGDLIARGIEAGVLRRVPTQFATDMLYAMFIDRDRMKRLIGDPPLSAGDESQRLEQIVDCFLAAFQNPSV